MAPWYADMKIILAGLAVLGGVLVSGLLMAGTTNELYKLKAGYADEKARIDGAYGQQTTNVFAAYRQSVDALRLALKEQGDLDGCIVLDAEKQRVAAESTVNTNSVPALAGVVAQYRKTLLDATGARDRARVNLQRQYVGRLTALMQNDTRADRLDDARAVRDELQTAKTDLVFLEADAPEASTKPPDVQVPAQSSPADDFAKTFPGTWKFTWRNMGRSGMDTVIFSADGTTSCLKDGSLGRWEIKERQCLVRWPRTVDTMTITADGKRMTGHTQQGVALSAVKAEP